jgi:hypothetical protein
MPWGRTPRNSPAPAWLPAASGRITAPRHRRDAPRPGDGPLAWTPLGLLGRRVDSAALARRAKDLRSQSHASPGFTPRPRTRDRRAPRLDGGTAALGA